MVNMERYAIFFPQFDRNKINDETWGAFFNDWILVGYANALNLWKQRRAPKKGFYNLANPIDIKKIFDEAEEYKLDGFGLYHYYFDKGPILDNVEQFVMSNKYNYNLKYFLIYANELWSKRWIGSNETIINSPKITEEFVNKHVSYIVNIMETKNYKIINGRPLFVFYRLDIYENYEQVLDLYKNTFRKFNVYPLIGMFMKNTSEIKFVKHLDFVYLFEPRLFLNFSSSIRKSSLLFKLNELFIQNGFVNISESLSEYFRKLTIRKLYKYSEFINYLSSNERIKFVYDIKKVNNNIKIQDILCPSWDNTPRYGTRSTALSYSTKDEFEKTIHLALANNSFCEELPLLSNAWNEWSEGAAIEPCFYLGDVYLKSFVNYKV